MCEPRKGNEGKAVMTPVKGRTSRKNMDVLNRIFYLLLPDNMQNYTVNDNNKNCTTPLFSKTRRHIFHRLQKYVTVPRCSRVSRYHTGRKADGSSNNNKMASSGRSLKNDYKNILPEGEGGHSKLQNLSLLLHVGIKAEEAFLHLA